MADSHESSDNESESDEVVVFRCRKCPGRTFTAPEKDAHRAYHRSQNKKDEAQQSKKSKGRKRMVSPPPSTVVSDVSLFQRMNENYKEPTTAQKGGKGKRKKTGDNESSPPPGKRKSRKFYDSAITGNWKYGTGAGVISCRINQLSLLSTMHTVKVTTTTC